MIKTIILSFPNSKLMPNNANGKPWTYNRKEKNKAKDDAYWATLEKVQKHSIPPEATVKLTMTYFSPDARHRDTDNLDAAMKSSIDGVSHALGIDDSKFLYGEPTKGIDRKKPRVEVKLEIING